MLFLLKKRHGVEKVGTTWSGVPQNFGKMYGFDKVRKSAVHIFVFT
jgi:hypothetical protein